MDGKKDGDDEKILEGTSDTKPESIVGENVGAVVIVIKLDGDADI